MRIPYPVANFLLILLLFLSFDGPTYGQQLLESRQTSYFTYIYRLTEQEAKQVYKKDLWEVNPSYFHTLVDSFPTKQVYDRRLPQGHYLQVYAEKNKEKLSITSVHDFEAIILNNNTDLQVQVVDLHGNIIPDAKVSVGWEKLKFNAETQTYIDRKSNQKGLLEVQYQGFTAYYNLARQHNNSFIIRGSRKLVYGTPLKYVWIPINFTFNLSIDTYKSITQGWAQGAFYRTKYFFQKIYRQTACLFDDYYCDYYSDNKFRRKHDGYIVFNKPKYFPGDTVYFKAYLVNRRGKAVDEAVRAILHGQRKPIELSTLRPYHKKGGYAGAFVLHDSLQLQLDRSYDVSLRREEDQEYIRGSFHYEDYELSKNHLKLRLSEETHYRNQPFTLFASGTDENQLNLLDGRLELLIRPKTLHRFFTPQLFLPDTLLYLEKELSVDAETEIQLPDSLFPKANFDYEIQLKLLTSDNEVVTEKREVSFYHSLEEFTMELIADSLQFGYQKNGLSEKKKVQILAEDDFGNSTEVYQGTTPCQLKLEPYYSSYTIQSDSISETFSLNAFPSLIQCYSERTSDSVHIVVENPRQIPFSYHLYRKNNEQKAGYTDSLTIKQESNSKQTYFISLSYLWGGEVKEESYQVPLEENTLHLSLTQPKLVYPGQKSCIEVLVTDYKNEPVSGVDLTAYSMTSKFSYSPPQLPYLGKQRKGKRLINNFHFQDFNPEEFPGMPLDYEAWKTLAGLDSIEYYQFIYPKDSIYRASYTALNPITQFAPFVVSDGAIEPVHIIYVDKKPVYFSWSTHSQPYAFPIDSGFHQIGLRTARHQLTLDSLYFPAGEKLIFSIDEDIRHSQVQVQEAEPELSKREQQLLYRYIFPYRNTFGERFAYLELEDGRIQWLNPSTPQPVFYNLAGPVAGPLSFHLLDSTTTHFQHEPFFQYEFAPGLLKMRQLNNQHFPKHLNFTLKAPALSDSVLSREALRHKWQEYLEFKRYSTARYSNPRSSAPGAGRLSMAFARPKDIRKETPLNILLFKKDDHEFLRVYPGNTSLIHQLEKGWYRLLFFYPGARYHIADSIQIRENGLNFYEFAPPSTFQQDTFSLHVSKLIEETLFKSRTTQQEDKELLQMYTQHQQRFRYRGAGDLIEGYVYDEAGEPLPGANVLVKGTNYGTVTDMDGYYALTVPPHHQILNFSFIGFVPEDVSIGNHSMRNVYLEPDIKQLQEVVVTGYGIHNKRSVTASVATAQAAGLSSDIPGLGAGLSQSLQGKVAGVKITTGEELPGHVRIQVRGMGTVEFGQAPLYIIDGQVFTGDISELNPAFIEKIRMIKDGSVVALYGARAAHGVVIMETRPGALKPGEREKKEEATFFEAASQASSIRSNFSDYAFWQPSLTTDENGKVSFEVTFPDDVTSWETYYLAMNGQKQSGQTQGLIKSYKPLMAQLAVPRFLLQSDTSYAIGKVLNYFPQDSVRLTTRFELDQEVMLTKVQYCTSSLIDSLPLITGSDSLHLKYFLEKEDGYMDGEQKSIPVYPLGLEESKGKFMVLEKDTLLSLDFDPSLGPVKLYARADILEVVEGEIQQLVHYKYFCNEQIASKLKGLLAAKSIASYRKQEFGSEREVKKLIRLLRKNQKGSGLWGWWKNSEDRLWISLHVLEALVQAEKEGYKTALDKDLLTAKLVWELENTQDFYRQIRMLKILHLLDSEADYAHYLKRLGKTKNITFNQLLHLLELKQLRKIPFQPDTLKHYQKETLLGNIYFAGEESASTILNNDIQNTLLAYRILRADSLAHKGTLQKIRNYFLEKKATAYWTNTYESAQIIETILPELLGGKKDLQQPSLIIKGENLDKNISEFPYEVQVSPQSTIQISKAGDLPVYFTHYQQYWNVTPQEEKGDFEITTYFENDAASFLKAGKKVTLVAKVVVKKDADFVMINVPIPAGCSYADKENHFLHESQREYYRNETTIFCEKLAAGEYFFEINLTARYSGTYTLNPAKVELMYFPTFKANNNLKSIRISQ